MPGMRTTPTARFAIQARVQVVKKGPNCGLVGRVVEVDLKGLFPHYWVDFKNVFRLRYVEAELRELDDADRTTLGGVIPS